MKKDQKQQFFTRQKAEEGKEIALKYPDGSDSPHWLRVKGIDSDTYKAIVSKERKVLLELDEDDLTYEDKVKESQLNIVAGMVTAWSFDEECTFEAVKDFLKEAPQIRTRIDTLMADRSYFFGKEEKA